MRLSVSVSVSLSDPTLCVLSMVAEIVPRRTGGTAPTTSCCVHEASRQACLQEGAAVPMNTVVPAVAHTRYE